MEEGVHEMERISVILQGGPPFPQVRNSIAPTSPILYIGGKHVYTRHTNVLGARGNSSGSLTKEGDQKVEK